MNHKLWKSEFAYSNETIHLKFTVCHNSYFTKIMK